MPAIKNKKFTSLENFLITSVLGLIPPLLLMQIFWWSSIPFVKESSIKWFMLTGFLLGLLFNIVFLTRIKQKVYEFNAAVLILIYLFYMIGFFGFFMGVPIFNILPGIAAGAYLGKKYHIMKISMKQFRQSLTSLSYFNFIMLLIFLTASALLAITDRSTASNLEGMFNLRFEVTSFHLWGIIIMGGSLLLIGQYLMARFLAEYFYK